jgi:Tol biopolymer transport system component
MVRILITTCLLIIALSTAAETSITLNQGANITVTAPAAFNDLAFDLGGQIWLQRDGHEPATPLTPAGAFNQRPVFSRDGRFIAYESMQSGYRQIFVTEVKNGATRQVTFGPYDHLSPTWSPAASSQSRLALSSNRSGSFDIWEVNIDNLELRQLTFTAADEREPAWNDDGTRLAYVAATSNGSSLYILTPGDKPRRILQERGNILAPAWRPDGGLLTYTRQNAQSSQLRMLILSTPPITKLITRHEQVSPRPAHWLNREEFLYAADGKIRRRSFGLTTFDDIPFSIKINIHSDPHLARSASFAAPGNRSVLGIIGQTERADGRIVVAALSDLWEFQRDDNSNLKLVRQLTNDAFIDMQPAFSPDGQRLAFVSDRSGRPEIWIMEHDTAKLRRLTRHAAVIGAPIWNPDGTAVAYRVADESQDSKHGYRLRLTDITSGRTQKLPVTSNDSDNQDSTNGTRSIETKPDTPLSASVVSMTMANQQPLPLSWRPATGGERYIIRAGQIFDGIGPDYLLRQEIVIEQGLIVAIRPWSDTEPDTPVIDASMHTVIPGLIDLAVRQESINNERLGRKWLAAGVTTIRMTLGQTVDDFNQAIEQLESWSSGRRIGPRLMMTVRPCRSDSGQFDEPLFAQAMANIEALNIVAVELCPDLTGAVLADVVERTREQGLSVIATTPVPGMTPGANELRPDALLLTGKAKPDPSIWHDFMLISGTAGAVIPSRLITASRPGYRVLDGLNSSWQYRKIFTPAEQHEFNTAWYQERESFHLVPTTDPNQILGAGGGIILGSEAPSAPQGLGLHVEMRRLAASSMQPFQILKLAGLEAARSLGYGESLGRVHVGRLADLVIVDGDPLSNIDATAKVVGTIINGRYFSRQNLVIPGRRGQSPF